MSPWREPQPAAEARPGARQLVALGALLTVVAYALSANASPSTPQPIRALYGLARGKAPLKGKTPAQVLRWLRARRFNAVFGGYRDKALRRALAAAKIKVFASLPLFVGKQHWRGSATSGRGRPITADGKPLAKDGWYAGVCPNQPKLRAAKLRRLQTLLQRYRVDGVWLDFIRYPLQWARRFRSASGGAGPRRKLTQSCFCSTCLARFAKDTKLTPPPSARSARAAARWILGKHRRRFVRWKTRRIADFVRRARGVLKRSAPKALLGVFTVPWRPREHADAVRSIVGQDARLLAKHADVLSPMTYHLMVGRRPAWIAAHVRWLATTTKRPVLPVVQACSVPTRLTHGELTQTVRSALARPSAGVVLFSVRHFLHEKRERAWLEGLTPRQR